MIARWSTDTHTHTLFFINCIYWTFNIQNYYKILQTWSRFLKHTKHISSSIAKVGRLNIMEYLDLCRMREVGYTSTKLLSVRVWETRSESAHGHCLVGFVFKHATHSIRCSSAGAGGYQTALRYCERPLLDWWWIVLFFFLLPSGKRFRSMIRRSFLLILRMCPNL